VTLSRKLTYFAVTLVALMVVTAGCAKTQASGGEAKTPPPPPSTVIEGLKPGQVGLVAYYPLNEGHKYIADYLKGLEQQKEFKGKVKVEINDLQTSEGREKWKTTGLGCAGVFVNGKTRWEVLRDGKKETIDFIKRMDSFWTKEDFLAVLRQQLADPKKTPVVPSAKKPTAKQKGERSGK
jgi:hypothetical protein